MIASQDLASVRLDIELARGKVRDAETHATSLTESGSFEALMQALAGLSCVRQELRALQRKERSFIRASQAESTGERALDA